MTIALSLWNSAHSTAPSDFIGMLGILAVAKTSVMASFAGFTSSNAQVFDDADWATIGQGIRRNITIDQAVGSDDRRLANGYARKDRRMCPDPNIILHNNFFALFI